MRRILAICAVSLLFILYANPGFAKIEVPGRTELRVNDYAGVVDQETKEYLEGLISLFEQKTRDPVEIIVATFISLEGWRFEDFAFEYGEKWRLTKKGRDNGVILLFALEEGRIDVGVGRNLSKILTTPVMDDIVRDLMMPELDKGNFGPGIRRGVERIIEILSRAEIPQDSFFSILLKGILKMLLIILIILAVFFIGSKPMTRESQKKANT